MLRAEYRSTLAEAPAIARQEEHAAIMQLIDLIDAATRPGSSVRSGAVLACNLNAIWSALVADLVNPANDLPDDIKARLISIGIHVIRRADDIGRGMNSDLASLREIHQNIADGLE